ncbi:MULTISPECIES: CoA transferase [Rhizobium/Agrobacterium group]|uniref:CaiB/BaiF CoA transferase family protein n=1 Tax=Rhizobium/Agrobacterium group TaxID=227290 RepID=UPI000712A92D|nr:MULTISPECIES: CoA transferase [Rhizobium/Agrobacterium group]KRA64311.1 carnitine dehydratase [Rhizobium sp. Root651]MDH1270858.1 CoA transferase [Agrobacterium pusense]
MAGALDGIRVLDLSRVLGGPYCTQTLADYGAEVIKVEPPQGDETRGWGPPFNDGLSAYFSGANRNKRSIAIDIGKPQGRDIILRLLEGADVVVHNFKAGALEKWGLGYEAVLRERFPKLILCHVTGFGADGPLGSFPGYDAVVQAITGLMSINGNSADGPTRMGTPIVDIGTGLIACNAILAALIERFRSGLGQVIEVPLYDGAISMMHPQAANALMSGKVPVTTGNGHPNIVPYDMFETRTGKLYLAVGNNGQFVKLCEVLGLADVPRDPRFADNAARLAHRSEITAILADRLAECDAHNLEPVLLRAGVPAGVVRNVNEALEHPHTRHRGMVVSVGSYRGTGIPARFSRTPGEVRMAPPRFAQHSRPLLQEAGFSDQQIDGLIRSGVVLEEQIDKVQA